MSPNGNIINQVKILCEQMPIRDNMICLLHYGSVKQKEDFNEQSDLDFHLVLKQIDEKASREIKDILILVKIILLPIKLNKNYCIQD